MMNKYYTPTIEEFYVGFEYEYRHHLKKWIECSFGEVDDWSLLEIADDLAKENCIRVKYLDKEDIESLGFSRDKKRVDQLDKQLYTKGNVFLMHFKEGHIAIWTRDPSRCDIFSRTDMDPKSVNYIKIKNKSELKKLLKQLNIEDE